MPQVLSGGYSFIINGKVGSREKTLCLLSGQYASVISSSLKLHTGVFLSLHGWARPWFKLDLGSNYCVFFFFPVCREHVLSSVPIRSVTQSCLFVTP